MHNLDANRSARGVSAWREPIDYLVGRTPRISASRDGRQLTYELLVLGGVMQTELFLPPAGTRLVLRIEDGDQVTARISAPTGWTFD